MKTVKLPHGIEVQFENGRGSCVSQLHKEPDWDIEAERFNAQIDALESIILAQACSGVDVESEAYRTSIETCVDALTNQGGL